MMETIVDGHNLLGEGVLWCERSGRVLWTDIEQSVLYACAADGSALQCWHLPERLCSFALTEESSRLLLALASRLAFFDLEDGVLTPICAVEAELPSTRLNDGRCDRQGRFVFGSFNQAGDPKLPLGGFYRLNHDLSLERLPLGGVAIANSICFSPDGATMYYADSATGEIRCCDYDPASGAVSGERVFVAAGVAPGEPDGATIDADGCLWSARWGAAQVARFTPDGRLERVLELAASQPSCPAFGGPSLDVLFVTSARVGLSPLQLAQAPRSGALFAQALAVRGLPEVRFHCY
jgi:L-arabinonolactonase